MCYNFDKNLVKIGVESLWKLDRRILAHFDFISLILIISLVVISGWLIGEIHPILAKKHMVYVGVAVAVFILFFFLPIRRFSWMIPIFTGLIFYCFWLLNFLDIHVWVQNAGSIFLLLTLRFSHLN